MLVDATYQSPQLKKGFFRNQDNGIGRVFEYVPRQSGETI
jgi:hypothetical protein